MCANSAIGKAAESERETEFLASVFGVPYRRGQYYPLKRGAIETMFKASRLSVRWSAVDLWSLVIDLYRGEPLNEDFVADFRAVAKDMPDWLNLRPSDGTDGADPETEGRRLEMLISQCNDEQYEISKTWDALEDMKERLKKRLAMVENEYRPG